MPLVLSVRAAIASRLPAVSSRRIVKAHAFTSTSPPCTQGPFQAADGTSRQADALHVLGMLNCTRVRGAPLRVALSIVYAEISLYW